MMSGAEIAEQTGLEPADIKAGVSNLATTGMVDADLTLLSGEPHVLRVNPPGYVKLGEWPSTDSLAEILPDLLAALAEQESDSDRKAALDRVADIMTGTATGTLTALIRQLTGMG